MPTLAHDRIQRGGAGDVVFLHGILGSRRNWRSFATRLAAARPDLGVVTVDLRNHGDSHGFASPHGLDACARDVRALTGAGVALHAVVGHSFGGKVALRLLAPEAGEPPATLRLVAALDCTPGSAADAEGSAAGATAEVTAVLAALQALPLPIASREALVSALRSAGLAEALALWMTTNLAPAAGGYHFRFDLNAIPSMLWDYAAIDAWPQLEAPPPDVSVHFIRAAQAPRWSAADIARLEAINRRFRAGAPAAQLTTIDAGHWLHAEAPDALLAWLLDALGALGAVDVRPGAGAAAASPAMGGDDGRG